MSNIKLLQALGIELKGKVSGEIKTVCPKCSAGRKKKNDPCLNVDIDSGLYNCWNAGCDFSGRVFEKKSKEYVKPLPRLEKLNKSKLSFFEQKRRITNDTLLRFKVTEGKEWMPQTEQETDVICFNYYRGDNLVNIKFRSPEKGFKMAKDAELIFYNLNAIKDTDEAVIVEGEIDCLTVHQCGIHHVVSVPNGASKGQQKLEYLDNCWEYFVNKKRVIIAVDDDEAGRMLKEELGRRIGKEKCWLISYPEGCKDANEVLISAGDQAVKAMFDNATQWPIEGIVAMDEMFPDLEEWFKNGYPPGASCGIAGVDELITFQPGQLTLVTGIPGHGKDEFLNWITTGLAKKEDWKFGIAGFEEPPAMSVTKLQEKLTGKSFAFRKDKNHKMSKGDFDWSIGFVDQFFYFIDMQQVVATMEGILEKAEKLVKRYGINAIVINPWNYIEDTAEKEQSETSGVARTVAKLVNFLVRCGLHGFLVAHPRKMNKIKGKNKFEKPTLYDVSGSAHFYNMIHNGFAVYRNFDSGIVELDVLKVKWSWLGKTGWSHYTFDTNTRQYSFYDSSEPVDYIRPIKSGFVPVDYTTPAQVNAEELEFDDDEPF